MVRNIFWVVLLFLPLSAFARQPLTMKFKASIQSMMHDPTGDLWQTVTTVETQEGLATLQFYLSKSTDFRLVLEVEKPIGLRGNLRARTATRTDGVLLSSSQDSSIIIFGPQNGCKPNEPRCRPLTIDDIGYIELRMDVEKAKSTSFGLLLLRPFDEELDNAIIPSLKMDGNDLACGSTVDSGWFIFANSILAESSITDTISLCVTTPSNHYKCAKDKSSRISIKVDEPGYYIFETWNSTPNKGVCEVLAS